MVNHQKGTLNYKDINWIGLDSVMMADVFFKYPSHINSVNIGYLENTAAWIFPPEKVKVLKSKDGISFDNPVEMALEIPSNNDISGIKNLSVVIEDEVKALRIIVKNISSIPEWHPASGNAGWVFTDEWIFYK